MKVRACKTYVRWTAGAVDRGRTRVVRMVEPWDPRVRTDFRYECDCEDFRAVGTCLHVLCVKGHHCGWHQAFDAEELKDPDVCPRCGRQTVEVEYADG